MYSNCLFEAIKAKLKDPKNVQIIFLPQRLNIYKGCHFLWIDKTCGSDIFFEFVDDSKKARTRRHFFFKGHVSSTSKESLQRAINAKLNREALKIERKYGIKTNQREFEKIQESKLFEELGEDAKLLIQD